MRKFTQLPACRPLRWALALLLITLQAHSRCTAKSTGSESSLMKLANFQLVARAKTIGRESLEVDREVTVGEFYSNELARARLEVRTKIADHLDSKDTRKVRDDAHQTRTYIHDSKLNKMVRTNGPHAPCELASELLLVDDLFSSYVTSDSQELRNWLAVFPSQVAASASPALPSHVIGFARLLVLVELNWHLVQRPDRMLGGQVSIRNQQVDRYELELAPSSTDSNSNLKLTIYTPTHAPADTPTPLPLRIWLRTGAGVELIVDYSLVGPLEQLASPLNDARHAHLLDQFNLPVGRGCSGLIKQNGPDSARSLKPEELYLKRLLERRVVSFEAALRSDHLDRTTLEHLFVAFDGYAGALRLDRLASGDEQQSYTMNVHDLLFEQKYHVEMSSEGGKQSLRSMVTGARKQSSECFATSTAKMWSSYEPIVPFLELVEMGTTHVRGMRARVYEHVTRTLPPLLFPQVIVTEATGRRQWAPYVPGDEQTFTVVYYFSLSTSGSKTKQSTVPADDLLYDPLDQLVRLEVYDGSGHFALLHRAEVYNFRWQLAPAPNGDPQDRLFALQDLCVRTPNRTLLNEDTSVRPVEGRGATWMELELAYLEPPNLMHLSADQVSALVSHPPTRNKALIRALSSPWNSLFASQILSVRSRLVRAPKPPEVGEWSKSDEKRAIRLLASIQLAGSSGPLEPQFEAWAFKRGVVRVGVAGLWTVTNFDECFWRAAREFGQSRGVVLFGFCELQCFVDSSARRLELKGSVESRVFFFPTDDSTSDNLCEISEMRTSAQSSPSDNQRVQSWSSVYANLNDKMLTLRLIDAPPGNVTSQLSMDELYFRVDRLELNPLASSADELTGEPLLPKGLGLAANAELNLTRISPTRQQLDSSGGDFCRAQCLANLECRSYSSCLTSGQQLECVLGPVDLRNRKSVEALEDAVLVYRATGGPARGSVAVEARLLGMDLPPPQTGELEQKLVEFRLDSRCRLRTRQTLELFKRQHARVASKLAEQSLVPVESIEQCADLCVEHNAKFFKRVARTRLTLDSSTSAQLNKSSEARAQLMEHMLHWCTTFRFLDLSTRSMAYELISYVRRIERFREAPALCYLSRPKWASWSPHNKPASNSAPVVKPNKPEVNKPKAIFHKLELDAFEFQYVNLYERQPDVRLAGSEVEPEVGEASSNKQTVEAQLDVELCARACFSQAHQWCRSFDFVHYRTRVGNTTSSSRQVSRCVYNSITLADAKQLNRSHLLIAAHEPEVQVWHYEPQGAYAIDNVLLIESVINPQQVSEQVNRKSGSSHVFLYLAGVVSGLLVALYLSATNGRLISARGRRAEASQQQLVNDSEDLPL